MQKRGAAVIAARKLSSAMSAAKAICDHLRSWWHGTSGVSTMSPWLMSIKELRSIGEVLCIPKTKDNMKFYCCRDWICPQAFGYQWPSGVVALKKVIDGRKLGESY